MPSPIDISNMALAEIGTRSSITAFNDGSVEGYQCGLWYDTMRRRLLRTANWGFARLQISLSLIGDLIPDNTGVYPFLYKYQYPSNCLKFRYVIPPPPNYFTGNVTVPIVGAVAYGNYAPRPSRAHRFLIGRDVDQLGNQTRVILSNVNLAIGTFTEDSTDTTFWDDLFIGALQASIASKIVIPLTGNVGMKKAFEGMAQQAIMDARVADGNEAIPSSDHTPDWIVTRGVGSTYGFGPGGGPEWGQWYSGNESMGWGE